LFEGDAPRQIIAQLEEAGFKRYDAQLYYREIDR